MNQPATARQDAPARPDDEARLPCGPVTSPTARRRLTTGTGATLVLAVASVTGAGAAHADQQYTVRAGDTVSHLALRSGVPAAAIVRANNLPSSAAIRVGQTLTIPAGAPAAPAPSAATYTVVAGDTVSGIAARHGSTVAAVSAANGLDARGLIRIGQTLTIPGAAGAAG
jgi:N-acetylmuramoyl-L-alanine amidase